MLAIVFSAFFFLLCSTVAPMATAQDMAVARGQAATIEEGVKDADDVLEVVFPDVQHPYYTVRDQYYQRLLKLALDRSGVRYRLKPVLLPSYSEARSVSFIQEGRYDVHWLNTTPEREAKLRPVRIPLDKGAIGWRVFFIRPEMQSAFDQVKTVEDLRRFTMGQGHDWADVGILLSNGFRVERSSSWLGLFKMVQLDRIQAFPRSIVEVTSEQRQPVAQGLVIEQSLILRYPAAYYFFVHKDNAVLAEALRKGLESIVADGSFEKIYHERFGREFLDLGIGRRTILTIPNKALQDHMPLNRSEFWLDKDAFIDAGSGSEGLEPATRDQP